MQQYRIPFNRPTLTGNELTYIMEAVACGHISGDGYFSRQCHTYLEETLGVKKSLLTTSCTHALEMCALLSDIQPGDEFIVPTFTFTSTANAFVLRGARPVFIDSRPDTLNLDEAQLESHITPRTKAVVVVHYAGVACEMDAILAIARRHGLVVIEDNAHGLFGTYKGRYLGTFGALATQSFHETKNFTCGEGGALLINDPAYTERAEIIREKGTDRSRFFRGQVDKYSWISSGSSYLPSELLAAFLMAQFEARDYIQGRRKAIWEFYDSQLASWAAKIGARQPIVPEECKHPSHLYYLLMPSLEARDALIKHLLEHGIISVFHYIPLHTSPMGQSFSWKVGDCPVAEEISERLIRLPLFSGLSDEDLSYIVESLHKFRM